LRKTYVKRVVYRYAPVVSAAALLNIIDDIIDGHQPPAAFLGEDEGLGCGLSLKTHGLTAVSKQARIQPYFRHKTNGYVSVAYDG
jgi:hypothetical protein